MGVTYPGLEPTKRVFDSLSAYCHDLWSSVQPGLDGIKNGLMLPTADPTVGAGRILGFNVALRAMRTPITARFQSAFNPVELPDQALPSGATLLIGLGVVS